MVVWDLTGLFEKVIFMGVEVGPTLLVIPDVRTFEEVMVETTGWDLETRMLLSEDELLLLRFFSTGDSSSSVNPRNKEIRNSFYFTNPQI